MKAGDLVKVIGTSTEKAKQLLGNEFVCN